MNGIIYGCLVPHPPIIIPEIGKGEEIKLKSTINALNTIGVEMSAGQPEVVLVISPHGSMQHDAMGVASSPYSQGSFLPWGIAGLDYRFNNDLSFVHLLEQECHRNNVPLALFNKGIYELDWGVLVPAYYILQKISNISLVPVTFSLLSYQDHFLFGGCIRRAAEKTGKKVAIIASGDLSHRLIPGAPAGYDPFGKIFDKKMIEFTRKLDSSAIINLDPILIDRAGECGLRSIIILLGILQGSTVKTNILSYECPFGVGYMTASFHVDNDPEEAGRCIHL